MSNYIIQEFDFINRTKTIIEQYDALLLAELPLGQKKFEVTLLLNCLVGLLILPQQNWYDKLPVSIISQNEWGINESDISFIKNGEPKNVKNVARHIRNSISHYNFIAFENSSNEIDRIKFEDYDGPNKVKDKMTFEAVIPVSGIRQFTETLTNTFTEAMEKEK